MKRTCKRIIIDTQGNDYSKFPLKKAKSNAFAAVVKNNKHMKKIAYLVLIFALVFIVSCNNSGNDFLSLDKKIYSPGELIKISYTADTSWDANAWVGIIPSNIEHGSEYENDKYDLVYAYINKKSADEITFSAPLEPGKYDIRMHDTDFGEKDGSKGTEVAFVSFEVK